MRSPPASIRTGHKFREVARGQDSDQLDEESDENHLGNLKIFAGVREFPVRVKCATLPWHTLHAALNKENQVSTE